jgi:hypothetical protein
MGGEEMAARAGLQRARSAVEGGNDRRESPPVEMGRVCLRGRSADSAGGL